MIANVEMLSGSKPNTQMPIYKAQAGVIGMASQSSPMNRSDALIARHTYFLEVELVQPLECLQLPPDLGKDHVDKTRRFLSMAYFIQ
jgi:hypothetical protein